MATRRGRPERAGRESFSKVGDGVGVVDSEDEVEEESVVNVACFCCVREENVVLVDDEGMNDKVLDVVLRKTSSMGAVMSLILYIC